MEADLVRILGGVYTLENLKKLSPVQVDLAYYNKTGMAVFSITDGLKEPPGILRSRLEYGEAVGAIGRFGDVLRKRGYEFDTEAVRVSE